jgi:hypothetical protein
MVADRATDTAAVANRVRRTTVRSAFTTAASLALVTAVAGSCSGSTDASSPSVLGSAFQHRAVAVCRTALAQKKAEPPFPFADFNPTRPNLSELPRIGQYELTGVQIFHTWLGRMTALGTPPEGRTAWSAVVAGVRAHARVIAEQQAAAARRDAATFTKDYYEGNHIQARMKQAAQQAGVPICATAAGA